MISSCTDISFSRCVIYSLHLMGRLRRIFDIFCSVNTEENLPNTEALLRRGAISVARSFIPGNRCAVDKTIEETFMKNAKSRGGMGSRGTGLSGIATNYNAYQ